MKKVKEVLEARPISTYMGSPKTLELVKEAIKVHPQLGPKYVADFDPFYSAMTYSAWKRQGYVPAKGSVGIKSVTFIESEDGNTGAKKKIPRTVILFHRTQVQALSPYSNK